MGLTHNGVFGWLAWCRLAKAFGFFGRWLVILGSVLGISNSALAADLILERSYFSDPSATLTLDEVRGREFTPFDAALTRGYTPAATWVRLRIAAPAPGANDTQLGDSLIVRVRPTYLDEIQLFDSLLPGTEARRTGDRSPPSVDVYPALSYNFSIPRGEQVRDIYLRLKTTSTSLMYVEVLPLTEAIAADRSHERAVSTYLAVIGFTLIWALLYWLSTRDVLIGIFAVKQSTAFFWSFMLMGLGRTYLSEFLSPDAIDALATLAVLANSPPSIVFDYFLLRDYRPPRWGSRLLLACLLATCVGFVFFAAGERQLAVRLNASIAMLSMLLAFALFCLGQPRDANVTAPAALPKAWPLGIYGLTLLLTNGSLAMQLGLFDGLIMGMPWLRAPALPMYGVHAHSLTTGLLMVGLLALRARNLTLHRREALTQLAIAEAGQRQERSYRQDQERLLAMLAHELKTPLGVIRLRLAMLPANQEPAPSIKAAVRDINQVIDRCLEVGVLGDRRFVRASEPVDLAELLREQIAASDDAPRYALSTPTQAPLLTDPSLLRGIVSNLLVNAGKYSPPGSAIEVALTAAQEERRSGYRLSVSNLPGVAGWPAPERLFDKYYRSEGAHRQTGSGLGLYLVQAMCHSLGGSISYVPSATHICFSVWLPKQ